jgi:hypothetical protein
MNKATRTALAVCSGSAGANPISSGTMLPPDQPAARATQVAGDLVSPTVPADSALRRRGSSGSSTHTSANSSSLLSSGLGDDIILRTDRLAQATAARRGNRYAQNEMAGSHRCAAIRRLTNSSEFRSSSAAPTSAAAEGKLSKRSRTVAKRTCLILASIDANRFSLDAHGADRGDLDRGRFDCDSGLLEQDPAGTYLELDADVCAHLDRLLDLDRLIV